MKTLIPRIFTAVCVAGLLASATAQQQPNESEPAGGPPPGAEDGGPPPEAQVPPPEEIVIAPSAGDNTAPETSATAPATSPDAPESQPAPAATPSSSSSRVEVAPPVAQAGTNSSEIRLNFHNAPLDLVLKYLSDAAGFIIILDTPVSGTVSVISSHPVSKDEAVGLLNSVLNKNGYAAIRSGRTLTIVDKNSAKTRDIPVKVSNEPSQIPKNDEIVTQIIPIRFVEASQLVKDLSSFVSSQATIVANEAGNSIVITDTQANIRHLVEIIRAIDSSAEGETEIRVFKLTHANPSDVANVLGQVFPSSSGTGSGQTQSPIRFGGQGGGGGGPGGFFARMMAANAQSGSQNSRAQKQSQVVAVADGRTSSVVVTASKDLMKQIGGMIEELDVDSTRDQKVYVFHMDNGDPQQAVQVLQNMFQSSSSSSSSRSGSGTSSSQNSALMQRQQNNSSSSSSSVSGSSTFGGSGQRSSGGGLN